MSPVINLINDQLLTDGNNNSSLYWLYSPSSLQADAPKLRARAEPGLGAHRRTRRDLRRAGGGCWGQQACCIPGTLLGWDSGCLDSQGFPQAESGAFAFAVLVQCHCKAAVPQWVF